MQETIANLCELLDSLSAFLNVLLAILTIFFAKRNKDLLNTINNIVLGIEVFKKVQRDKSDDSVDTLKQTLHSVYDSSTEKEINNVKKKLTNGDTAKL